MTALWRNTDFLKLWAGQTVSQFGSQITLLALPLTAALTLHATPAQMGILSAFGSAPYLLVGLFAGVWVDRMRRRPILIVADIGRFALLLLIPLLAMLDMLTIPYLCAIAFLVGVLSVFFDIGYESYLPSLVGREHLIEGNGKLETTRSAAQVAGPGVAGALVQLATAPIAIVVDALSFLVSVIFLWFVRAPESAPAPRVGQRSVWSEIGEGLHILVANPLLRAMASCTAALNLFGNMMLAVYVLYATRTLGIGPGLLGLIFAVGSIGLLIGALLVGRISRRFGVGPTMIGGAVAFAVGRLCIPLASGALAVTVPFLMVGWFIGGLGSVVYNINNRSLRQAVTPDHLLGRVSATNRFLVWGGLPIGSLAGGTLGAVFGLRPTLFIGAAGMFIAFLWPLCSPIRTLREQPASGLLVYEAKPNAENAEDAEDAEIGA